MKLIVAYIKQNMLDDVIFALHNIDGFPGAAISEVKSIPPAIKHCNQEKTEELSFGYPKLLSIELICEENMVNSIVNGIKESAHTGKGDGHIYISSIDRKEII